MRGSFAGDHSVHLISEFAEVQSGEKRFAFAEENGPQCKVEFVDQPCREELSNRRRTAADAYVAVACGCLCLFKCRMDPVGDKMKRRAALISSARERDV